MTGSCFAVRDYRVHEDFGGDEALRRLRERLRRRNLRLILDFVPNHVAPDHTWVERHPEYFIPGTEEQLANHPQNWVRAGERVLAYGRDPYFDGWPDTLQLNYGCPELQDAKIHLPSGGKPPGVRLELPIFLRRTPPAHSQGSDSLRSDGPGESPGAA